APGVNVDLGVKAAVIGTILSAAATSNIGTYSSSLIKLVIDLSDDGKMVNTASTDMLVTYPPTGVIPASISFTTNIDNLNGTGAADTYNAVFGGPGATLNALDNLDGGAGIDTLNIAAPTGGFNNTGGLYTIKNVENLSVVSVDGVTLDFDTTKNFTGVTNAIL